MLLFIHGIQQSAGTFLPLIKSLIGNSNQFEDKLLLDSFCLWIPGYDKKDFTFDYDYLENEIYNFAKDKREIQNQIASKLFLTSTNLPIKIIKDEKINLVGCDVGASVAINFLAHNPELVSSLVMIDCGIRFDSLRSRWLRFNMNQILKYDSSKLNIRYESENSLYKRIFLGHLLQYPSGNGVKSYLEILDNYNFEKTFNKLILEQQKILLRMPILNLIDKKHGISNNTSIKSLQKIFDKKYNDINKKQTIIDTKSHKKIAIESASFGNNSIFENVIAKEVSMRLNHFYQK
jgi:pimeloyl-ACP methyl ester carboxylesterase